MNLLDERMAKIKRRSEEIIHKRKSDQKKLLLSGLPIFVCIVLCTFLAMPAQTRAPDLLTQMTGSTSIAYISVVSADSTWDGQTHRKVTGADEIKCFLTTIQSFFDADGSSVHSETVGGSYAGSTVTGGSGNDSGYIIKVMSERETLATFVLKGNTLSNCETVIDVTDKQILQLKILLGLPD